MPNSNNFSPKVLQKADQMIFHARETICRAQETIRHSQEVVRLSREAQADREKSQYLKAVTQLRRS